MPLDGLTLYALLNELNPLLKNGRVLKICQPEPALITLAFRLPGKTEILALSTNPRFPGLHTIEEAPPNPLQPPAFCLLLRKHLAPARLIRIEQQGFDRQIELHFETLGPGGKPRKLLLILEILGRFNNLYLVDDQGIILDALNRYPAQGVLPGAPYRAPDDQGKLSPTELSEQRFQQELRLLPPQTALRQFFTQTFQGFSQTAAREVLHRAGLDPELKRAALELTDLEPIQEAFQGLLKELEQGGNPAWYRSAPEDFAAYSLSREAGQSFPSTNRLLAAALGAGRRADQLERLKGALHKQLNRQRKRVLKKEALQTQEICRAEQADTWRRAGEALSASLHLVKKGMRQIEVPDYGAKQPCTILLDLDPRLSPGANLQKVFKRYQKAKSAQNYTARQLEKTKAERIYLEQIATQIDLAEQPDLLVEITAELQKAGYLRRTEKGRKKASQPALTSPESYLSADGLTIMVGRNNRQNDQLTFGIGKPHHLWLHARGLPGSHVLILAEGQIPPQTLEQAAHLAAYFSKGRTSPKVEVDYTERRHVRKPRGAKPGFVHYERAKTVLVDPTSFTLPEQIPL